MTISNTGYQSNDIATQMAVNSNHDYKLLHTPDNIGSRTLDELSKRSLNNDASTRYYKKTSIIIIV